MLDDRTERQIGAYTLVLLRHAGLLTRDQLPAAMRKLTVTTDDMRAALNLANDCGYRPLSTTRLYFSQAAADQSRTQARADDEPQPPHRRSLKTGVQPKRYDNVRHLDDGTSERRCARCGGWFPATADYFGWKDKAKGYLRSYCMTCWSERQHEAYLSEAQKGALAAARVEFVVHEGSDLIGLRCTSCIGLIGVGDHLTGAAAVAHTACVGSGEVPVATGMPLEVGP